MADVFKTIKVTQTPGGPLQQQLVGAVNSSTGAADAGKVVLLDSTGQISPSMGGGGGGTSVFVNGSSVSNPNFQDGDILWHVSGSNVTATVQALATNTATPVVTNTSAPAHAGQLLISQPGNASAVWADPMVQGLFAPGSNVLTANTGSTPINPVLIGAQSPSNLLENLKLDASGNLLVNVSNASVTVSGTVAATQSGTWNIGTVTTVTSVTNPVTVTGTVTANIGTTGGITVAQGSTTSGQSGPLMQGAVTSGAPTYVNGQTSPLSLDTAGNLRVTAAISGTFTPALTADRTQTGTITNTQSITVSTQGGGTAIFNITGSWTGTIVFEGSVDGTNWVTADVQPFQFGTLVSQTAGNGQWLLNVGGLNSFRVRGNTVATGTATVWIEVGAGSNAITIQDIVQGTVSVNNFPATQTVTGNVTAAQGSANTVANSWPVEVTDGTNVLLTTAHPGGVNIVQIAGNPVATATTGIMKIGITDGGGTSILSTSDSGTVGLNVHVTNTGGLAGTQYVEGTNIATTPTGTLAMGKNASNLAEGLRLDASNNLNVNVNTALPTGTNTIGSVKVTDGTNTLFSSAHPGVTTDAADGTPGLTVPATAIFAAGKDNATGFLHGLSTDSNGVLNVNASVSGSFTPALTADRTSSGTLTTINGAITLSTQGVSGVVFNVVNDTTAWAGTLAFEASPDGTNWYPVNVFAKFPSGAATQTTTTNGQWALPAGGLNSFRVRANTAITGGTGAKVWIEAGAGPLIVEVAQTTAANLNATVTQGAANSLANGWPVKVTDGTNVLGTVSNPLDVNIQNTPTVALGNSSANIGYTSYQIPTTSRMSRAVINFSTSGNNTLVAGVGGQTIRIWRIRYNVGGATQITYLDGVTAMSGPLTFTAGGGEVLDFSGDPWYVTSASNAFAFNSTNAVQVGGTVWYTQS